MLFHWRDHDTGWRAGRSSTMGFCAASGEPSLAFASVISASQQAGSAAVSLVIPLVICREAHVPLRIEFGIVSLSMLVLAIAPVLQALRSGPVGFGYLAPANSSAIYIPASIEAVQMGGLPLMFGMTLVAGLFEAGISRVPHRLRPLFPPEIAGLATFLVGAAGGTARRNRFHPRIGLWERSLLPPWQG
jgi:xanthine/uracil permease